MKNNEFFKALRNSENVTVGECTAFNAWCDGIRAKADFPVLKNSIWDKDVSDFLGTMAKAGIKKFGFFSKSTGDLRNIVAFTKAGWAITGTFEIPNAFEEYKPDEGLVFESRDYA